MLFSSECAERLRVYDADRQQDSDYLISNQRGGCLSRVFVQKQFQQFSEVLGFKVKPYTLRHTFAAHLAEKGMKQIYIQYLLGHVNYNSSRIYTRLMEHAQKRLYDKYQI